MKKEDFIKTINGELWYKSEYAYWLYKQLEDRDNRIDKAIEYIEKHFQSDEGVVCKIIEEYTCERNENFLEDLLDILKGDDKIE